METIDQGGADSFRALVDEVRPSSSADSAAPAAPAAPAAAVRRKHRATGKGRGQQAAAPKRPAAPAAPAAPAEDVPPMPDLEGVQLRGIFEQLINPALVKLGATPFSAQEVKQGADALAPVANHYAKAKAESLSIWGPLMVFGVTAGAPRAAEVIGRQVTLWRAKRNGAQLDAAVTVEVPAAAGATFSPPLSEEALRTGQVVAIRS